MKEFLAFVKRNSLGKCLENESLKNIQRTKQVVLPGSSFIPKYSQFDICCSVFKGNTRFAISFWDMEAMFYFSDDTYEGVIIKLDEFNKITFFQK